MVTATTGGTMNIGVRRRLMARVAAIGVAITMIVTAPLAPAYAASVDHKAPTVPAGTQTMTLHAKAPGATSGKISPFSNPLDITCDLEAVAPFAAGGHTDSLVIALAEFTCTFDIDGSPAPVPSINLTNTLSYDGTVVDTKNHVSNNVPFDARTTTFAPCLNALWASVADVTVIWPAGYVPPSSSARTASVKRLNFGDCPNDYVEVPDVTDRYFTVAINDLRQAELQGVVAHHDRSCDFSNGVIMDQNPNAGQLALRGSTVELTQSDGPPRTGHPCP
jgi:hypothetical protein